MSKNLLPFLALIGLALVASSLAGCGTINGYLANGTGNYIPHWAGGLPSDVPPRPGTAKYEEYMKERERKRLEPGRAKEDAGGTSSSTLDAIH
jgi:hypothetical protein